MNKIIWLLAGFSAAAIYVLVSKSARPDEAIPVVGLAYKLQDAWANHHTVI